MELIETPLLPRGFTVPASRNENPSKRLRRLLAEKPYVFAPGVYDPMGAQLVMYHGFDAVYFSGYSFAIGHLGTTDMDLYSSVEIADGPRRPPPPTRFQHPPPDRRRGRQRGARVEARPRAGDRPRTPVPGHGRARPALVRVPNGGPRHHRDLLHGDPQAVPQGAIRLQL